jgi:hypothetical protein
VKDLVQNMKLPRGKQELESALMAIGADVEHLIEKELQQNNVKFE